MRIHVSAALILAVLIPAPAAGQTPDIDRHDKKLERTTVKLFDRQPDVKGLLLGLTSDSVTVLVNSQRVEVPLTKVRRVDVGGDSLANGAVIGGLVTGIWCALICGQGLNSADSLAGVAFKSAAMGALIGAGIDGMHTDRRTIYGVPERGALPPRRPAFSISFRF